MPIYEYRCAGCSEEFSALWTTISQAEREPAVCPACGGQSGERLASGFGIGGGAAVPPSGASRAGAEAGAESSRELARTLQRVSRGGRRDLGPEFGEVTARLKRGEDADSVERSLRARVGERMQAH